MAKLNRFKALVFQDLTQLMPKKPFQNETIACFHNTTPTWRFWSFLEFSKRDGGQYLNRTKENEAHADNVNLPETLLAFPRAQMFQSAFSQNETNRDCSLVNINLKNLKTKTLPDLAKEDVSLKSKVIENENMKTVKSSLNVSESVNNSISFSPNSKSQTTYKVSSSKSLPRISLNRQKEKSSTTFTIPMETTRLQRSKSFSNQIVSRYSSGIAKARRDIALSMSKPGLSRPSIQVANMSSGSGKRNNRNRKKSKNNQSQSQECQPPCPPPPPPPPCCPPPPPPCCPEPPPPPPKQRREKKPKKNDCQPPPEPPCIETPPEKEAPPSQNKCDGWCPTLDKGTCYQSKCPKKKKKNPCPPIKPCPPKCFEPDPCEKPKAFCVGCPPNKKKKPNDRNFSTWQSFGPVSTVASRSFTSDMSRNQNPKEETVEERFNKRFPKPGPACKEANDNAKCKLTATIKPANDEKSKTDKNTCENNAVSSFAKTNTEMIEDLMRKEFEEVQKCRLGTRRSKKSAIHQDSSKIGKSQKVGNNTQIAKCRMTPIGSPYKTIVTSFLNQQNKSKTSEKINNHLSVVANKFISQDSSNFQKPVDKDFTGNFSRNAIQEMEPRNWLTSWLP